MKDRIKQLRKAVGLNQAEFGDRMGVKQQTVTAYECGNRVPLDVTITAIVREFNANEAWLRTGEGEMFLPKSSSEELADFFGQVLSDKPEAFRRRLAVALSKLSEKQWAEIADIVDSLVASLSEE